ncbi:TauD/TfdA family dioxygenase [Roseovarius sp. M141]|nr:TauD/TfdA family dioxygenase [Roseovarius sp. M141]
MVVFDNRRVLHGRDSFDPATGFRHLHGCYVDRGEFSSRLRMLARTVSAAKAA